MFWAIGVLGLLLLLAPFVLGFSNLATALWTSVVLGAAILIDSGIEGFRHDENNWEYWVTGVLGILAFVAPWALGFSDNAAAFWSSIVIGAGVAILSGIKVFKPSPQT